MQGVDIIGKYLRLRRELLEPAPRAPELAMRRQRVAHDMAVTAAELVADLPDRVPFLETMPWSDTLSASYGTEPSLMR